MLILDRKIGEAVSMTHNIEVKVLRVNGNFVKLGFTAPDEINIWRNEIFEQGMNHVRNK